MQGEKEFAVALMPFELKLQTSKKPPDFSPFSWAEIWLDGKELIARFTVGLDNALEFDVSETKTVALRYNYDRAYTPYGHGRGFDRSNCTRPNQRRCSC